MPHVVFIVSTGRTGTQFFGRMLGRMIPQAFSVHEPDVIAGFEYPILPRLRAFGFYHLFMGKLLGTHGARAISQSRLAGRLKGDSLIEAVRANRCRYFQQIGKPLIIEANCGWFAAVDALLQAFEQVKIVLIIRDPRDWVASEMDWGTIYGPRDWVGRLHLGRLEPAMLHDEENAERWPRMDRFERLCWYWQAANRLMLEGAGDDARVLTLRFEDLFCNEDGKTTLERMLEHITHFPDRSFDFSISDELLARRVHAGRATSLRDWRRWKPQQVQQLQRHCGKLMERFGYGMEPEWQQRIGESL